MHCSSNGKMIPAGLYLWGQNTHYFFVFPIECAQQVMLFYGLGNKMTECFCLEVATGLAVTRLE